MKALTAQSVEAGPSALAITSAALSESEADNAKLKADNQRLTKMNTDLRRSSREQFQRHVSVETVLARMTNQLERQVDDLRALYFSGIKIATAPLEKR